MPRRSRGWHRGLPVRLFAAIVVVAAFAVAATAYLAVHTTRDVIEQEQGRAVASNREVYSTLIGYAATHHSWAGAETAIVRLARTTGLRITLVAPGLRLDTSAGEHAPVHAATTIDPLDVDPSLDDDADAQNIAGSAVGPFRLSQATGASLRYSAQAAQACYAKQGRAAQIVTSSTGRPYVRLADSTQRRIDGCGPGGLDEVAPSEGVALAELGSLFQQCLPARSRGAFKVLYDVSALAGPTIAVVGTRGQWSVDDRIPPPAGDCLLLARHRQLAPYVAPAARLYLTDEAGTQLSTTAIPHVSAARVALAAAIVLGLSALVAAVGALSLGRSLRSVTHAARRMRGGDASARVPLTARRARRRTDDLTQLAIAFNDMAASVERGERRQRELIADVSHELRSPLTNITGWVEALQDGVAQPDAATLATIASQARQLEHVVNDLRDLALAEAGQLTMHPVALPIADLVGQARDAFAVHARDAGIELTTTVVDPVVVHGDPARLGQCLGNLVSNAIAYTARGGHVRIAARRRGSSVVIDVADDGIGISTTDLPHVFDRLWRADPSRSRRAGGSGLGLPIARRLARAHGGDVTVTSVAGHGSTFSLSLPTADAGPSGPRP